MDPSAIAGILLGSAAVSALVTAVLGHWNELSRAREERRQKRLAETYLQVVEGTIRASDWVDRTHPFMSRDGDPKPPVLPTDEEWRLLRARLSAYGSFAMQAAFRDHIGAVNDFIDAASDLDDAQKVTKLSPAGPSEEWTERWNAARKAVTDIRENRVHPLGDALVDLANAELAERRRGPLARLKARLHPPKQPKG
jgi:hypothetical protein